MFFFFYHLLDNITSTWNTLLLLRFYCLILFVIFVFTYCLFVSSPVWENHFKSKFQFFAFITLSFSLFLSSRIACLFHPLLENVASTSNPHPLPRSHYFLTLYLLLLSFITFCRPFRLPPPLSALNALLYPYGDL